MARKKMIYTNEFPYHIVSRTNNKDPFPLEIEKMWEIYRYALRKVSKTHHFHVHAFVLMDNHYHLVGSTHKDYDLSKVMHAFQLCVSKIVNEETGRINHLFGSRYKACLIEDSHYYANVMKYVFRNPVSAGICQFVEDYRFSSLKDYLSAPLSERIYYSSHLFEKSVRKEFRDGVLKWLNEGFIRDDHERIKRALGRTVFKPCYRVRAVKQGESDVSGLLSL